MFISIIFISFIPNAEGKKLFRLKTNNVGVDLVSSQNKREKKTGIEKNLPLTCLESSEVQQTSAEIVLSLDKKQLVNERKKHFYFK